MTPSGIISGILVGLIIGALGRLVVRNSEPVGCLLTLVIGVVAGGIGAAIGGSQGWGFWLTFGLQVLLAAVIVTLFTFLVRGRR